MSAASNHGVTPALVADLTGGMVTIDTPGIITIIESAVAAIRRWCGWHIWPVVTETVILDGPGTRSVQLPTLRLLDVGEVVLDGEVPTDYTWSQNGWLTRTCGWPDSDRALSVTMTHGFEEVPDLVRAICTSIARQSANPTALASLRVGERQESYAGMSGLLTDAELAVATSYRLPGLA